MGSSVGDISGFEKSDHVYVDIKSLEKEIGQKKKVAEIAKTALIIENPSEANKELLKDIDSVLIDIDMMEMDITNYEECYGFKDLDQKKVENFLFNLKTYDNLMKSYASTFKLIGNKQAGDSVKYVRGVIKYISSIKNIATGEITLDPRNLLSSYKGRKEFISSVSNELSFIASTLEYTKNLTSIVDIIKEESELNKMLAASVTALIPDLPV